jgi:hypothetical protein
MEHALCGPDRDYQVTPVQVACRHVLTKKVKPLSGVHENENAASLDQSRTTKKTPLEKVCVQLERGQDGEARRLTVEKAGEVKKLHP